MRGATHWAPVHQELDIHGIGVSRGFSYDQACKCRHAFLRPAVDGVESSYMATENYTKAGA
jgi:hypothetical protein